MACKIDVGIVLPTKDEPRWVQDESRFKDALKDTKYSVEILFSQGSSAKEKENVDALLAKGIKEVRLLRSVIKATFFYSLPKGCVV